MKNLTVMKNKYFYPKLSNTDLGIIRIGGPGLANCMFFASKAYIRYINEGGRYISPTWNKFSIGPYIRKERDKRGYMRIFNNFGVCGFRKILFIMLNKLGMIKCEIFSELGDYFTDLQPYQKEIASFFRNIVYPQTIAKVDGNKLKDSVAIHVRLGDYPAAYRISIQWYKKIILEILNNNPTQRFILFSDGSNEELKELLSISNVDRVFFGNAFADMWAISKCKMLIAADSTFSAWGAFLGNIPIIFNKRHFPPVYSTDSNKEIVTGETLSISDSFLKKYL